MARQASQPARRRRPPRPKRPRGHKTRDDILRIAKQLFSVHGYHATGIADVFQATGLSKGAFYHHFSAKRDLALAVLDRIAQEYRCELFEPVAAQPTPLAALRALLALAVQLNRRGDWCNCRIMLTFAAEMTEADGELRERVHAMMGAMFERVRGTVEAAQAAGELRRDVPAAVVAQWILFMLSGFIAARKLDAERAPAEQVFAAFLDSLEVKK